jgi:hypothetical protein
MMSADCPPERRERGKIAKILHDQVLPHVAGEQGFRGVWFFFDRQNGKLMSITLYDTEADLTKAHEDIKEFLEVVASRTA